MADLTKSTVNEKVGLGTEAAPPVLNCSGLNRYFHKIIIHPFQNTIQTDDIFLIYVNISF
jgi:hypothetical protein